MTDSKIWGPYAWYMMHEIAFNLQQTYDKLPSKISKYLRVFYTGLHALLPCPSCRTHYGWTLSKYPLNKYNRSGISMAKWTVTAHNLVNQGLKKKTYTYSNAKNLYLRRGVATINHKKLSEFIRYILEKTNTAPLATRKSVASVLIHLYPCHKCRTRLQLHASKNPIYTVKTSRDMNNWAKRLRWVAQAQCK